MNYALLCALGIFLLMSCAPPQNAQAEPLKIGAVLPLTGTFAFYGQFSKAGIDLAVEDANAKGGLNGRAVQVLYEDAPDKTAASTATQKLISVDKVDALTTINPFIAGVVVPIAEANKVPLVYISGVDFSQGKTYAFKDYPETKVLCEKLAKQALKDGKKTFALLGFDYDSTPQCAEGTSTIKQFSVVEKWSQGETDYRTQLTKIKNKNPDALFIIGPPTDCANVYKQLKELDLNATLYLPVYSWTCGIPALSKTFAEVLETARGSDVAVDESSTDSAVVKFRTVLEERNQAVFLRGSAMMYDIVMQIMQAYKNCTTKDCAANALRQLNMQGISGSISYGGDQVVERDIMITAFENGTWKKME